MRTDNAAWLAPKVGREGEGNNCDGLILPVEPLTSCLHLVRSKASASEYSSCALSADSKAESALRKGEAQIGLEQEVRQEKRHSNPRMV